MTPRAAPRSGALCWRALEPCPPQGVYAATEPGWALRAAAECRAPHNWSIGVNPRGSTCCMSGGSLVPTLSARSGSCLPGVPSRSLLCSASQGWAASRGEPRAAPLAAGCAGLTSPDKLHKGCG